VGVPGLVALICLGIFVGAPYLTGLANVWEIVLILIGFALIGLEIFVIPGFGIAGISGILCVLVGLLATFVPNEPGREFPIYWPHFEYGLRGLRYGAITIGVAFAASIVGMALISRVLPKIRWLHGVIPENPQAVAVTMDDPYRGHARVGDRGKVESALRPAGKARFENMLVDVVTEGELIDPPAEVEVIERRGNRVVVRRVS
jgi:membrane-bound serine protease (ClpP class)